MSVKSATLKQLRFIQFKEKVRVFFMFLGNVAARGNRLQSQSVLLSAIYSIRFRSEGTVPSNTLGVGVSRAVAASEFEAISGDRLSKKKKKKKNRVNKREHAPLVLVHMRHVN